MWTKFKVFIWQSINLAGVDLGELGFKVTLHITPFACVPDS